jgi:hypothetical protein
MLNYWNLKYFTPSVVDNLEREWIEDVTSDLKEKVERNSENCKRSLKIGVVKKKKKPAMNNVFMQDTSSYIL